jgi:hypothetical protein
MRWIDCSIFFSSLRSRSRVRSSRACSSSMVARSAGSGTTTVSSRRCSVVSPAFSRMPRLSSSSFRRKNAICFSFMYSSSGMAMTSASLSSAGVLVFQLLASFGSFLTASGGGGTSAVEGACEKLDLAAVEATDCGIEGTVSCDSRDTRPPRAGAGVAV